MKNKIAILLLFLAGTFLLSSCLKDDEFDYWKDDVAGKKYATFATPGFQAVSLLPVADEVEVPVLINIASDEKLSSAVTVNIAFDNDAIAAYDSTLKAAAIANGDTTDDGVLIWKDYKPFPSARLVSESITIAAGGRNAYATLIVDRADTVQLSGNYMIALTITSAPEGIVIAENMKTVLYAFPIANEYEGDYLSEGFRNHPVLGIEPYKYAKLRFTTINANTVHKTQVGNYGGYGLDITITDQTMVVAGVTVFKCNLQITDMANPADQIIYPDYEGQPTNYYNPITKVFDLYYAYNVAAPRKIREVDSRL